MEIDLQESVKNLYSLSESYSETKARFEAQEKSWIARKQASYYAQNSRYRPVYSSRNYGPSGTSNVKVLYSNAYVPLKEGSHTFYAGNCTRYVASNYKIDWGGNAGDWLDNAAEKGYTVKDTPEAGDVFVSNESSYGHTGIVKEINEETGTMVVEEMNYKGYGVVSQREVPIDSGKMKGFIDGDELQGERTEETEGTEEN